MELELGTRLYLRDMVTLDDLCDVTAPAPVEPSDILASAEETFRAEVVLVPAARCSGRRTSGRAVVSTYA